jgi:tetratricopeptide (TPR) repeat protein
VTPLRRCSRKECGAARFCRVIREFATPSSTPLSLSKNAALQESAAIKSRRCYAPRVNEIPFLETPTNFKMKLNSLFGIFKRERLATPEAEVIPSSDSASSDAKTFTASGIAKAKSKDYLGALEAFDRAINIDPAHPMAYLQRSMVKSTLKDHAGAERDRKQGEVLLEQMDIAMSAYDEGRTKYYNDDYEGSLTAYDKAVEYGFTINSILHEIYHGRGLTKKAIDDFNGALSDFNKAIKFNPCYAEAFHNRGLIKSHKLNDDEGALEDYNIALQLNPSFVDAYYSRAILRAASKDNEGSFQDLSKAIELEPADARLYFARSLRKSELRDWEGAIQDLSSFIDLAPTDTVMSLSDAYSFRGSIRSITKNLAAAIQDQSKAIELDPSNSKAFFDRGVDRDYLKDHQGAIVDFSKAIELDPSNADAYHSRGLSKLELGMEDEGRKDLIEAIALGYEEE